VDREREVGDSDVVKTPLFVLFSFDVFLRKAVLRTPPQFFALYLRKTAFERECRGDEIRLPFTKNDDEIRLPFIKNDEKLSPFENFR